MARLIDADAYADELKRREKLCFYQIDNADVNATVSEVEYWSGVIGTFNEAMCVLADAPTVSGWVSVKDRVPEEDADVLVWNELGIEIAAYTTNPVKRWYSYTGQEVFAKYWMQLPEPPKEDDA